MPRDHAGSVEVSIAAGHRDLADFWNPTGHERTATPVDGVVALDLPGPRRRPGSQPRAAGTSSPSASAAYSARWWARSGWSQHLHRPQETGVGDVSGG
jgi:hypothetical protein